MRQGQVLCRMRANQVMLLTPFRDHCRNNFKVDRRKNTDSERLHRTFCPNKTKSSRERTIGHKKLLLSISRERVMHNGGRNRQQWFVCS